MIVAGFEPTGQVGKCSFRRKAPELVDRKFVRWVSWEDTMLAEHVILSHEEQSIYSETRALAEQGADFQEFLKRWQAVAPAFRTVANRGWLDGLSKRKRRALAATVILWGVAIYDAVLSFPTF